jgi:hypothetical protein
VSCPPHLLSLDLTREICRDRQPVEWKRRLDKKVEAEDKAETRDVFQWEDPIG